MFYPGDNVELSDNILTSVLFDENEHFAGFKYVDALSNKVTIDTPLTSA